MKMLIELFVGFLLIANFSYSEFKILDDVKNLIFLKFDLFLKIKMIKNFL